MQSNSFFFSTRRDLVAPTDGGEIRRASFNRKSRGSAENHGFRERGVIDTCELFRRRYVCFCFVSRSYRVCREQAENPGKWTSARTFRALSATHAVTERGFRNCKAPHAPSQGCATGLGSRDVAEGGRYRAPRIYFHGDWRLCSRSLQPSSKHAINRHRALRGSRRRG